MPAPKDAANVQRQQKRGRQRRDEEELRAERIQMRRGRQVRHFRSLPFQQVAFADPEPIASANDGIQREIGLMRQEGSHDDRSIQVAAGFTPGPRVAAPSLHQTLQQLNEQRNDENQRHQNAGGGWSGVKAPTADQEHQ